MRSCAMIDALEGRRFLSASILSDADFSTMAASLNKGVLGVPGTTGNDKIIVAAEGTTKIGVTVNGTKTTYDRSKVKSLLVSGDAGNDEITVNLPGRLGAGLRLTIGGGAGNDAISTNVPARIEAGAGNDTVTGSPGRDIIIGGDGDDTLTSGGGSDFLYDISGTNTLTYANGNQDFGNPSIGVYKLVRGAGGNVTIRGTRGADTFVFSKQGTTGSVIKVTAGVATTTLDLSQVKSLTLDGSAGADKATVPTGLFGNVRFSKRSIEA